MEYLHHNKELFEDAINLVTHHTGISPQIVEKDYYITMILRLLAEKVPYIVFKGGTSLSKCHHAIKRFSEDIDITIDDNISQGEKRKLKSTILETVEVLGLSVGNLDDIRSRRDYNRYEIAYNSVVEDTNGFLQSMVLLETSFTTISFPTELLPVSNYIGEMMQEEAPELLKQYILENFYMKVQGIERTLIDKVFAICDYYMQGKVQRHSRHLYDIYKLMPLVSFDEKFKDLVKEVRDNRKESAICVSAQDNVDIVQVLEAIIAEDVYKSDYTMLTRNLLDEVVLYEDEIVALSSILASGVFANGQEVKDYVE